MHPPDSQQIFCFKSTSLFFWPSKESCYWVSDECSAKADTQVVCLLTDLYTNKQTNKQTNTYTVLQILLKAIKSEVAGNIPTHSKLTENLRSERISEAKGFLKVTSVYDNAEEEFPKGWEAQTTKPRVLVV